MLKLYDYLPSQNAWKIRQILVHLDRQFETVPVSIFEGEGRRPEILRLNPTGKVPILVTDDGRPLAESNAILAYLADGSAYLPADSFRRGKVHQWLCFEQEQVESVIGSLRHWTMTGKLARRSDAIVAGKRAASLRTLAILDEALATQPFIAGEGYTIADISIYAYAGHAEEAGLDTASFAHFNAWRRRVEAQPGFLATTYPYSIDPHSVNELP